MLLTISLIITVIALFYTFLVWNFSHWKKLGINGPKPKPFFGNFPNSLTQKEHTVTDVVEIYRKYRKENDFVGVFSMRSPQVLILSPELCRRVLVSDFKHFHDNEFSTMVDEKSDFIFGNNLFALTGEAWKDRRALLTAGLTIGRVKASYPLTNKICRRMTDYVKQQLKISPTEAMEAKELSLRFTTEMVTDCVLGLSAKSFDANPTPIMKMIQRLFESSFSLIVSFMATALFPSLKRWYKMRLIPLECQTFFVDLMQNAVSIREAEKQPRSDFLNYLLQLKEKKEMSALELTSNVMTFLLDGFDTTATVLSHCMLFLARHPDKQERLRKEVLENLNEEGFIDFEKLLELPYLNACIHESIRLFPPGFMTSKLCTEPIELTGKNGVSLQLQRGDVVIVPFHAIMNDDEYYENASEFVPERFLQEGSSVKDFRERGLFYGFSDGPRVCLGMRFALTQMKAALAETVRAFNIKVDPKTRTDLRFDPKYFLARLDGGVWLQFEERQ